MSSPVRVPRSRAAAVRPSRSDLHPHLFRYNRASNWQPKPVKNCCWTNRYLSRGGEYSSPDGTCTALYSTLSLSGSTLWHKSQNLRRVRDNSVSSCTTNAYIMNFSNSGILSSMVWGSMAWFCLISCSYYWFCSCHCPRSWNISATCYCSYKKLETGSDIQILLVKYIVYNTVCIRKFLHGYTFITHKSRYYTVDHDF